ncbi:MAG TPA: shikimate kinase [Gemmataceae bacterium]|jgi:shikimate kinase|nr:shikimate kinase [Gemmataceae bacterium]
MTEATGLAATRTEVRDGTIVLIGLRGTGKTTVGQLLAKKLGLPFFDADTELEAKAGRSIRDIFANEGETYFRNLEAQVLQDLLSRGPAVIATGGGVVLREENRQRLRSAGKVVWLTADVDTLGQRLRSDDATWARRPNLLTGGIVEITELSQQRDPLYRECSTLIVDTAGRSPEEIAEAILPSCTIS